MEVMQYSKIHCHHSYAQTCWKLHVHINLRQSGLKLVGHIHHKARKHAYLYILQHNCVGALKEYISEKRLYLLYSAMISCVLPYIPKLLHSEVICTLEHTKQTLCLVHWQE